jgi:hypothetical protein
MKFLMILNVALFAFFTLSLAQDTLYSEKFANGVLQNTWYAGFNGNNMEPEFQSGNPSGDGWVGRLGNDLSGGGVGQSYSGNLTWIDYKFEAQVFINTTEGTYYGIEFRVDSTGNTTGYQFLAKNATTMPPAPAALRFRARENVIPVPVIREWTGAEIPGGYPTTSSWHKMAVRMVGNQFWFYFDDQELPGNPYTDNTFTQGPIGAYVWDFTITTLNLYVDDLYVMNPFTSIDNNDAPIITDYLLNQNYPNPFNPSTVIPFELSKRELVNLSIYNNLGQKVRTLLNQDLPAGAHQAKWDGQDNFDQTVPAGVYYYTIQAGEFNATRKMLLIK